MTAALNGSDESPRSTSHASVKGRYVSFSLLVFVTMFAYYSVDRNLPFIRGVLTPQNQAGEEQNNIQISSSFEPGFNYNIELFQVSKHLCTLGMVKFSKPGETPERFTTRVNEPQEVLRHINYTTKLHTNMKLLVVGDSVGIQMAHMLEEALGARPEDQEVVASSDIKSVYMNKPDGGGVMAGFRHMAMFLRRSEDSEDPVTGWSRDFVNKLLNHTYYDNNQEQQTIGSFHAMVFRASVPWIDSDQITHESLLETVELAHELFGVRTIIFVTPHFNNNIITMEDLSALQDAQQRILEFSESWNLQNYSSTGVENVFVIDMKEWTDSMDRKNAEIMGMITKDNTRNFTLERVGWADMLWKPSIARVCAEYPEKVGSQCVRNRLSKDGIHLCMETMGGSFVATVGCMLACAFERNPGASALSPEHKHVQAKVCAHHCHSKFMSLDPDNEQLDDPALVTRQET